MRVEVYWNLHKRLFSVRALEGENKGRVIEHAYTVSLVNAKFAVQPAGRERVRQEGKKNVHAFVRGRLMLESHAKSSNPFDPESREVTYNPYLYDSFVDTEFKSAIHTADYVDMDVMLGKGKPYPRIQVTNPRPWPLKRRQDLYYFGVKNLKAGT